MNAISTEVNERRRARAPRGMRMASLGNISLDLDTFSATVGGRMIDLTYLEFDLLRLFVENPGRIIPCQFWTTGVLSKSDYGAQRHLAVLVHRVDADRRRHALHNPDGAWPRIRLPAGGRP